MSRPNPAARCRAARASRGATGCLRLPPFLRHGEATSDLTDEDLQDGFRLTGLFLLRHVLEPRGQVHSDARAGFINALTRQQAKTALPAP